MFTVCSKGLWQKTAITELDSSGLVTIEKVLHGTRILLERCNICPYMSVYIYIYIYCHVYRVCVW
jgi:hypothetical protein